MGGETNSYNDAEHNRPGRHVLSVCSRLAAHLLLCRAPEDNRAVRAGAALIARDSGEAGPASEWKASSRENVTPDESSLCTAK